MLDKIESAAAKLFDKITASGVHHLTPVAVLQINGQPFGTLTMSRIISVQLADNRGFEADELTLELADHDGHVSIPPQDSLIRCWLGYKETGVVDKGLYKMSEFTHSGSPDKLSITARAADLSDTLAQQEDKSWHKTTVYAIADTIAKKHGYPAKISDIYKDAAIAHIDQTGESDASFLTRLAQDYDAIATIKNGTLLFMPQGQAQTAGGQPMPPLRISRQSGDSHSFTYSSTDAYNAVRAYYTEPRTGKKAEVLINADNIVPAKTTQTTKRGKAKTIKTTQAISADGLKIKTLRHLYASKTTAENGARAAYKRIKRGAAEFKINLAQGRPDVSPETPVTVAGFKVEIDAEKWLIKRITHTLNDGGYTAALELEALLDLDKSAAETEKAPAA